MLIGVGTATIINLASFNFAELSVYSTNLDTLSSLDSISLFKSLLFFKELTLFVLISKPIVGTIFPNSTANGKPTYPSPTTAILVFFSKISSYKSITLTPLF
ncbi:MAG: hypothetical protein ACD_79C00119G0003 [uncultured bacterium]|nr:MAG: hypothetical protein ACD_79C00119G0003 [uncultured bacterium]